MDPKLMFLWMTWIFHLHNRNQLETKVILHFQSRKKKISDASDFFTSFNAAAVLLAENIRTVGLEISKSIASEVVIQQKIEMTIQENALKLYPTLCEVKGLTEDERYRALSKISDHPTQMLIFFSLPSVLRLEWVRRFLVDY
ncbi:hypothetical protein V6Z11_A09G051900 [Gossypium hirsutum]